MSRQGYGAGFTAARWPLVVGAVSIVALVAGFGTWAAMTEIDGAVVASGRVIVDRNRQAVQHPDGGVVQEVAVTEGARVEAGDVLVRFDPTLAEAELRGVEGQLAEILARRARLEAERDNLTTISFEPELLDKARHDPATARYVDGQTRLFEMRKEGLEQELVQLENKQLQLEN